MIVISHLSAEYVRTAVQVDPPYDDPTSRPVWIAWPAEGIDPVDADWNVAAWEGDGGVEHTARALADHLTPGAYDLWTRVDWPPESVRLPYGKLVVR